MEEINQVPLAELTGFAALPADTFAEGPPTGEGIDANGRTGPFEGPPVQGFSGVQFAPASDGSSYWFLSDNGFGSKANSPDYLLRIYQVDPSFVGSEGGDGSAEVQGFVQLSDPNNLIPFDIQNEGSAERNLTGSDFDIESFVIDGNGDIWIGEEFGPYLLHFDSTGQLIEAPIATPNITSFNTLNGQDPLVIGHRGASGLLPEHTLEAYSTAIAQGADFIEPDLVMTKDGVLIARHEPMLDDTTNVAEVFGEDRMSTKLLDGAEVTAYFAEDFTLAEIKQLRAVQSRSYREQGFNNAFEIPTFEEVIELVKQAEADTGKVVGIYPETKHPTFFDEQGMSLEEPLVKTLLDTGFTDPDRIFIQSFELQNVIELDSKLLPEAGLGDVPVVQLFGDTEGSFINDGGGGFSVPYDFVVNADKSEAELREIYGDLVDVIDFTSQPTYADLANPEAINVIGTYAEGLGPWKNNIILRESLDEPVDGDGDGNAEITTQLTGEIFPLVDYAHDAGLQVHPYTLRDEERFLTLTAEGTPQTPEQEFVQLTQIGVDGFFTDFPATGVAAVEKLTSDLVYSPDNPAVIAGEVASNLRGSRGYEGMAFSPDRSTLYPMLEGTVFGDPAGSLRIYEFDVATSAFEGIVGLYQMDAANHAIGDFTPINDNEYLVIERDGRQAADAAFKKIFKVDLSAVDSDGFVEKELVVDLLNVADPNDLNGDGETTFNFPFVTIEDVLVLDKDTILVANDNNYPFSIGRDFSGTEIDNNEIIQLKLNQPLDLDPRLGVAGFLSGNESDGSGADDDGIEIGSGVETAIANARLSDNADDGVDVEGDNSTVTIKEILSTMNTEEGLEIDGSNNTVLITNASFSANGDDGFDIDETGKNNTITISEALFADNGDDGFDIFGVGNTVTWSRVTSTGNTEEGFEIDGDDNLVNISYSSLSSNGDDGFQIDDEGSGNIINFSNTTLSNNVDGIDINGSDNIIGLFQVGISNNSGTAVEVEGDNNTVTISSSVFSDNGEFALLIEGSNNRITISDSQFLGSGNGILDTGSNNIITVLNSTGLGEVMLSDSSTLLMPVV